MIVLFISVSLLPHIFVQLDCPTNSLKTHTHTAGAYLIISEEMLQSVKTMDATMNNFYSLQKKLIGFLNLLNSGVDVDRTVLNHRLNDVRDKHLSVAPDLNAIQNSIIRELLTKINEYNLIVMFNTAAVINNSGSIKNLPSIDTAPRLVTLKKLNYGDNDKIVNEKDIASPIDDDDDDDVVVVNDVGNYLIETASTPTSTVKFEFDENIESTHASFALFNVFGSAYDYFTEFKYLKELDELLNLKIPEFKTLNFAKMARYQWAGIVAKALINNDIANVDFKDVRLFNQNKPVKMKCILRYLNNICMIMRTSNKEYLRDWALAKMYQKAKSLSLLNSTKPILFDEIRVLRKMVSVNESDERPDSELHVMYVNDTNKKPNTNENDSSKYGLATPLNGHDISLMSAQFCECPELYATLFYLQPQLDVNACVLFMGFLKAHVVEANPHNLTYVKDVLNDMTDHQHLIAVPAKKYQFDKTLALNNKTVLDQTLGTYALGIKKYYKHIKSFRATNRYQENDDADNNKEFLKNITDANFVQYENNDTDDDNGVRKITEKYTGDADIYGEYETEYLCTRPHGKHHFVFRFFTECAIAMEFGMGIKYVAKNDEQENEILNGLQALKRNNHRTVGALYRKLLKYNFNQLAKFNFE
ncbi:poly ADP-ribose glycohydrolase [Orgyia pseudotsugata single capsid nuclopolyhedrovirus]|nr:poly ADP-ribose glycohydrolase [Orgyia pseudotsugata single capsid nuclopolyhedrovirus]